MTSIAGAAGAGGLHFRCTLLLCLFYLSLLLGLRLHLLLCLLFSHSTACSEH